MSGGGGGGGREGVERHPGSSISGGAGDCIIKVGGSGGVGSGVVRGGDFGVDKEFRGNLACG